MCILATFVESELMQETFFTSKQAAKVTGCTLRQLQYWREKGVVVPVISGTGTGRSLYYSRSDLVELAVMEYWLSVGLSFDVARQSLKTLKDKEPEFFNPKTARRLMLTWNAKTRSLKLVEFDLEEAIASLKSGQPVIPLWLDAIHEELAKTLVG